MAASISYSKMAQHIPWEITVTDHPGSSEQDIKDEPDWAKLHSHAIGFKNHDGRRPGFAHSHHQEEIEISRRMMEDLSQKVSTGELVNFRDLIESQEDFHLRYPDNRSLGWRYVLETTEDWVKNQQNWPANVEKRKKQEEEKKKKGEGDDTSKKDGKGDEQGKPQEDQKDSEKEKEPDLDPQERSLLAAIERDARTRASLKVNDGKQKSPQTHNRSSITIEEQDQFTPDNWLPRCPDLIRLTGKHPMNAEPTITRLHEGGLITPNELHYIRNHGAVPRLLWEFHRLDVTHNNITLSLTMDQLKTRYAASTINIPIVMACDGNRRKELNLLRKTKGANNAAGSVGCAYWKGPTLRSVLLSAGVPDPTTTTTTTTDTPTWVHFAGADTLSGGTYETCLPLAHAMDAGRDVLLATHMNDVPLPPDHGYPVRLMVLGSRGRAVEVALADLVRAPSVIVRCSDAGKNMQPRDFKWNILGMMNNSWYTVKTETVQDEKDGSPAVVFRHPTEAAAGEGR
ncbi:hypothetical protein CHGG_10066 [Chaetomium globosum CBS 148.51]|uniref:Oxidoreductase molybdopterin-binding domain-containing protein n=1 Tax=Chaetomium globosum (strain ATCC 6205 / CBS 148.51 / DSM 1962 / NBRC 6347 / NRRL 1970) TaxID=306901 RepID=Q2GPN8_CHAGB|nr:uncharacterized protein CHGG_10066 [Chaetomium globosum CBS 148.51]EAQ83662.1 hypothetical protein CHGG_10066 [Chaetomium globosum CBS 148.51]